MNYFDLYSSYPDRTIVAAWDSQLEETRHGPWFKELLLRSGSELFPRFAVCYAELRALPLAPSDARFVSARLSASRSAPRRRRTRAAPASAGKPRRARRA